LALVAVALRRSRRPERARVRLVLAAAASYVSLFFLLLWQALRGISVAAPDAAALASIAVWAALSGLVFVWIGVGARDARHERIDGMPV
jgi:hypothetical protein